jgi:hypothetical protein
VSDFHSAAPSSAAEVVTCFNRYISFAWGVLYLYVTSSRLWSRQYDQTPLGPVWVRFLISVPLVFKNVYSFSQGQAGLAFLGLTMGSILGLVLNPLQERLYRREVARRGGQEIPEARLLLACLGAWLFPAGACKKVVVASVAQG